MVTRDLYIKGCSRFPPRTNYTLMKKIVKGILFLLLVTLMGIQFIPVDRTNPPVTHEVNWDSPQTREIAKRACFDCHSHETVWPWYSYVAPFSLRIAEHVEHGREHLNFSDWSQPNEEFEEIEEVFEEGEMPLWDYLLIHSEAKLTVDEREALLTGLQATYQQDPPVEK